MVDKEEKMNGDLFVTLFSIIILIIFYIAMWLHNIVIHNKLLYFRLLAQVMID